MQHPTPSPVRDIEPRSASSVAGLAPFIVFAAALFLLVAVVFYTQRHDVLRAQLAASAGIASLVVAWHTSRFVPDPPESRDAE